MVVGNFWSSLLLTLLLLLCGQQIQDGKCCSIFTGPSGERKCLQVTGYTDAQWAICLSKAYILETSSGRHKCGYPFADYCYYQCEVELNNNPRGSISPKCKCDSPGVVVPPILDPWCYSPGSGYCNWYSDCLQKTDSCKESLSFNEILIPGATVFCGLHQKTLNIVSISTSTWLDATRRCLLLEMVPILRNTTTSSSCSDILQHYTTSKRCCYLGKNTCASSSRSICSLEWREVSKLIEITIENVHHHSPILDFVVTNCHKNTWLFGLDTNELSAVLQFEFESTVVINRVTKDGNDDKNSTNEILEYLKCFINEIANFDRKDISYHFVLGDPRENNNTEYPRFYMILKSMTNNDTMNLFKYDIDKFHRDSKNISTLVVRDQKLFLSSISNCKDLQCHDKHWTNRLNNRDFRSYCYIAHNATNGTLRTNGTGNGTIMDQRMVVIWIVFIIYRVL